MLNPLFEINRIFFIPRSIKKCIQLDFCNKIYFVVELFSRTSSRKLVQILTIYRLFIDLNIYYFSTYTFYFLFIPFYNISGCLKMNFEK